MRYTTAVIMTISAILLSGIHATAQDDWAKKNRFTYVDYHSAMKDAENGLPEKWSYDGVHLNGEGYDFIEGMILKVLK